MNKLIVVAALLFASAGSFAQQAHTVHVPASAVHSVVHHNHPHHRPHHHHHRHHHVKR
jgi:hypothetical protein